MAEMPWRLTPMRKRWPSASAITSVFCPPSGREAMTLIFVCAVARCAQSVPRKRRSPNVAPISTRKITPSEPSEDAASPISLEPKSLILHHEVGDIRGGEGVGRCIIGAACQHRIGDGEAVFRQRRACCRILQRFPRLVHQQADDFGFDDRL